MDLSIIPWGFARGRWDHFRVSDREAGTLCRHRSRSEAEKCIAQRVASDRCIDMVQPVSPELRRLLADLSELASTARLQERAPESLFATIEQVRATADAILSRHTDNARSAH